MNDKLDKILAKMERLEQQVHELQRSTDQQAVAHKDNMLLLDDNQRLRLNHMETRMKEYIKRRK